MLSELDRCPHTNVSAADFANGVYTDMESGEMQSPSATTAADLNDVDDVRNNVSSSAIVQSPPQLSFNKGVKSCRLTNSIDDRRHFISIIAKTRHGGDSQSQSDGSFDASHVPFRLTNDLRITSCFKYMDWNFFLVKTQP